MPLIFSRLTLREDILIMIICRPVMDQDLFNHPKSSPLSPTDPGGEVEVEGTMEIGPPRAANWDEVYTLVHQIRPPNG